MITTEKSIKKSISGGFNRATVAWLCRNGVYLACHGPSCTWKGDTLITQEILGDESSNYGVYSYDTSIWCIEETYQHIKLPKPQVILVSPIVFAEACKHEGFIYNRIKDDRF